MAGSKPVEKATKGLNALVDEFTSAVKELVNAGEETAVHLAVGGGRAISAIIDASGEYEGYSRNRWECSRDNRCECLQDRQKRIKHRG